MNDEASMLPVVAGVDAVQLQLWDAALSAWLIGLRRRSQQENTSSTYACAVRQFFEWSEVAPWHVSGAIAQRWAAELDARDLSSSTVNVKLAALKSFYEFVQFRFTAWAPDGSELTLWPKLYSNPFQHVTRARVSPYGKAIYPTVPELQRILGVIDTGTLKGKRDFALIYTLALTCRRASEVLQLRLSDVEHLRDGGAVFTYRYKGGETRRALLHETALEAIRAYLQADGRAEWRAQAYVFRGLGRSGDKPLSNRSANRILKQYAAMAGVEQRKAHVHALRHAGARLRVEQQRQARGGVDYLELMQLLGHSSLAVTQIYSQQVLEDPEDPGGDAAAEALMPKRGRKVSDRGG